jgi:putative ABC transport system permease protein
VRRIAWASVRGHPLRTLATALSVVFGVAFVTGTFVFTDTVRSAFDQLFGSTVQGTDVVVRMAEDGAGAGQGVQPDVAGRLADLPGVAAAEAKYRGYAKLADDDGEALGGFGALLQGVDTPDTPSALALREGRMPEGDEEIAIDAASADTLDKDVGDEALLLLNGPEQPFTISGIVAPPSGVEELAGSTTIVFSDPMAERLYGGSGATYISVLAADDVEVAELRNAISAELGQDFQALTVDELVDDSVAQVGDFLGFLTRGLLVFAGAALLVGAIIIFNTFGITVTQRTREFALVQAVGADSMQVVRAVLLEASITGVVGSALGVLVGVVGAMGLRMLLDIVDLPLPSTSMQLAPRTIVVGMSIGIVVTLIAAVGPALRAAKRAPIDALRNTAGGGQKGVSTLRLITGCLVGGVATTTLAGTALDRIGMVGLAVGATALTLSVVLLSPLLAAPMTAIIGAPIGIMRRLPGRLARANAVRNPARTASTATALLVGLGLVTFVLILVSSFRTSLDRVIVEQFKADFQLQAADQMGYPRSVTAAARKVEGIEIVSAAKVTRGNVNNETRTIFAIDPATMPEVFEFDVFGGGSIDDLGDRGVVISEELGVPVGATVQLAIGSEQPAERQVVALMEDLHLPGTTRVGQVLVTRASVEETLSGQPDLVGFVKLAKGADPAAVRTALDEVVAEQPDVSIADNGDLRAQVRDQTNQLLGLVIGLVLLSVIVAFVGVVNILGLSIIERGDELGLLQALGMSRQQARQMVRWESVIITMLGTVVGLALGTLFGWLGVRVLRDEGLGTFSMPLEQIAIAVVVMLVSGVLASVLPARRASRADVLRAVTIE